MALLRFIKSNTNNSQNRKYLWYMHLAHAAICANNPQLIHAAKNVFAGLFHIQGNNNYSIIELFDTYIMETWRKNSPDTFKNIASNEGTNLTNEPYCAQANDARHKIINKTGQHLYKGETADVF